MNYGRRPQLFTRWLSSQLHIITRRQSSFKYTEKNLKIYFGIHGISKICVWTKQSTCIWNETFQTIRYKDDPSDQIRESLTQNNYKTWSRISGKQHAAEYVQ